MKRIVLPSLLFISLLTACNADKLAEIAPDALKPIVVTEPTPNDTDDPAIWIDASDARKSIIVGTDKDKNGGLYAYNLEGKILKNVPLKRPNNVAIAYGLILNGKKIDVAVVTERLTNKIRVFSLPDLIALDQGGIPVFENEQEQAPMGIALYTRKTDHAIFAIVGRKSGPKDGYLFQYLLKEDGKGHVIGQLVRRFGTYSGKKEIEAIAVDNELGVVYYSDEQSGIRKYAADPLNQNQNELAFFGNTGFKGDQEGISIYKSTDSTGYILVSNQQANTFMVYPREGIKGNKNAYPLLKEIPFSTVESDGSEVTASNLGPLFPKGVFVAMSNGKTFHYYDWRNIQEKIDQK